MKTKSERIKEIEDQLKIIKSDFVVDFEVLEMLEAEEVIDMELSNDRTTMNFYGPGGNDKNLNKKESLKFLKEVMALYKAML